MCGFVSYVCCAQGESVDSGTVVPGKRKILDFFLIKLFAYFFFLISLAKHFRSLKKHWQA